MEMETPLFVYLQNIWVIISTQYCYASVRLTTNDSLLSNPLKQTVQKLVNRRWLLEDKTSNINRSVVRQTRSAAPRGTLRCVPADYCD